MLKTLMAVVALLVFVPSFAPAQSGEVGGVITEIKPGPGRVEVSSAGAAEWRIAAPLLSLRAGEASARARMR